MAFTLPAYVLDASPVVDGLTLPLYVLDASPVVDGLTLPLYVLDATPVVDGLTLPLYTLTEAGPSTFTHPTSGGIKWTGAADIVGDPHIPTGGIKWTGAADINAVSVLKFELYPLGGIKWTGAALVSSNFIEHKPTGGIKWTGVASNSSTSILKFTHVPVGGVQWAGEAKDPLHAASGGIQFGGGAEITSVVRAVHEASGGIKFSGNAPYSSAFLHTPNGGVQWSGAAVINAKFPVHVPSGGVVWGGEALSVFVGLGQILTPENPYADAFSGWSLNYDSLAASRYEDLPFTSMARFKGKLYGTTAAGIYEYGADDDAGQPIRASLTVAKSDFNERVNKRVPYVYLGYKSDKNMRITVITNDKTVSYYDLQKPEAGNRGSRAKIGRGLDGLYWAFRVANRDGAFFELDSMKIEYTLLRKMGV